MKKQNRYAGNGIDIRKPTLRRLLCEWRNGQMKPGCNIQIGTENGFVIGYDLFANPGDVKTLKPQLKRQKLRLGVKPKVVIADAAYGSE